ncbi:hypothetical protein CAP35_11520 [Chitinophagaceae bacterium IBVUCB1]|nr:hypothetical protein CAP35_11520 [Chitinophagaceae bacterium IBVUCB1]
MKVAEIRERLQYFIQTAEEKKLKAIYTLVEDDIAEQSLWEDESFVSEMETRYNEYKSSKVKTSTLEQVETKARQAAKYLKRK